MPAKAGDGSVYDDGACVLCQTSVWRMCWPRVLTGTVLLERRSMRVFSFAHPCCENENYWTWKASCWVKSLLRNQSCWKSRSSLRQTCRIPRRRVCSEGGFTQPEREICALEPLMPLKEMGIPVFNKEDIIINRLPLWMSPKWASSSLELFVGRLHLQGFCVFTSASALANKQVYIWRNKLCLTHFTVFALALPGFHPNSLSGFTFTPSLSLQLYLLQPHWALISLNIPCSSHSPVLTHPRLFFSGMLFLSSVH